MAAILLALMVLVFTGLLAISMFLKRGQGAQDRVTREQSASLEYSRNLLVGFVMREGRLPCVAQAPHGKEDCAATQQLTSRSHLERTQDAIYAFARLRGRLPCAAPVGKGEEDCSLGDIPGMVPFLTIGLPDDSPIGYRVPSTVPLLTEGGVFSVLMAEPTADAGLAVAMTPLSALREPGVPPVLLDLCASLADPRSSMASAFELQEMMAIPAGQDRNLRRIVVSRTEAAGELNCSAFVAAARTYFNVLAASRIMQRGAADSLQQFTADYYQLKLFVSQTSYSITVPTAFSAGKAIKAGYTASAAYFASDQKNPGEMFKVVNAAMTGILIAGSTLSMASNLGRFGDNMGEADNFLSDMQNMDKDLTRIKNDVLLRAVGSSAQTYFLESGVADKKGGSDDKNLRPQ